MKLIASYILFIIASVANLVMGGLGGNSEWFPARKELGVMSLQSAIIVNAITLAIIAALVYLATKAIYA